MTKKVEEGRGWMAVSRGSLPTLCCLALALITAPLVQSKWKIQKNSCWWASLINQQLHGMLNCLHFVCYNFVMFVYQTKFCVDLLAETQRFVKTGILQHKSLLRTIVSHPQAASSAVWGAKCSLRQQKTRPHRVKSAQSQHWEIDNLTCAMCIYMSSTSTRTGCIAGYKAHLAIVNQSLATQKAESLQAPKLMLTFVLVLCQWWR